MPEYRRVFHPHDAGGQVNASGSLRSGLVGKVIASLPVQAAHIPNSTKVKFSKSNLRKSNDLIYGTPTEVRS